MKYTIKFKSGTRLELDVGDGTKFVTDIVAGVNSNPAAPVKWYMEPGILLAVSEVEFIVPSQLAPKRDA